MGYSYDARTGKLCCDSCGHTGGVRRFQCPFNWCPAPALCPDCAKQKRERLSKAAHRKAGCEEYSRRHRESCQRHEAALQAGHWVRTAAVTDSTPEQPDRVKVWFRNANGEERIEFFPAELYQSFPIGDPVTLEDFQKRQATPV